MAKESVQKNTLTRLYDGKRRVRTYLIEFAHITKKSPIKISIIR